MAMPSIVSASQDVGNVASRALNVEGPDSREAKVKYYTEVLKKLNITKAQSTAEPQPQGSGRLINACDCEDADPKKKRF
jgi:hypothetical protein